MNTPCRRNSLKQSSAQRRSRSSVPLVQPRPSFELLEKRQLMAGGGSEPDPIVPDPYEPNDSFATATNRGTTSAIDLAALSLHVTGATTDIDYFKFTAPANQVLIAQIDFAAFDGNLKLAAFNAAQQQIAFSDTSTNQNPHEIVSINAQAGQTYYLKIYGAACHEYSLMMGPLSAAFDWSMPKRTGAQLDAYGLPMFPNTRDYARPNPIFINGIETPRYPVRLSALNATAGDGVTYQWNVSSPLYSTTSTGAAPLVDLPQGQYSVTLSASLNGSTVTTTAPVTVKDYLVVGIGDSYGSGEGNPHSPQQYDFFGFTTSGAKWADSPNAQEAAYHRMAHRSAYAGVAQAALQLENQDPKSSVTFVFLDHTGATISVGLLGEQPSGDPAIPGNTPAQLDRLQWIVGDRKIDNMVISIGGNDMGFATVLSRLVSADPIIPGYSEELDDIFNDALNNITALGNTFYPQLAQRLSQFNIGQTFLTEYPDITRDPNGSGQFASAILYDIVPFLEVDSNELSRAYNTLFGPLATTMREACKNNGWTFISGVASAFGTHGYGNWLRKAEDSAVMQGPLSQLTNPISLYSLTNTLGTMHPISGGLSVQRDRIYEGFNRANLLATGFTISPQALQGGGANSTFTLTVKNTSFITTAPASVAHIQLSFDANVDLNDIDIAHVAVPALAPGQEVTVTGNLPHYSDPFLNPANVLYVGPVVDAESNVVENNEADNVITNPALVPHLQPERDLTAGTPNLSLVGTPVGIGSSTSAWLGVDEVIGDRDMDAYRFTVTAGQRLAFDIDAPGSLDTYVRLYPVSNNVIPFPAFPLDANDNGAAPGEVGGNPNESYLQHTFTAGGEYVLIVSHEYNRYSDPMKVDLRSHAWEGAYTLNISTVDAIAPAVVASSFDVDANKLWFRFSEDVSRSIGNGTVSLTNLTTGQNIAVTASCDLATQTASFTFNGFATGLPNGNYRATIAAGNVTDPSGNPLATDATLDFFALAGDANRDRAVDISDLSILATNWQKSGKTFGQGNFNYDSVVDISDLAILASNWQKSLPALGRAPTPSLSPKPILESAEQSVFSDSPLTVNKTRRSVVEDAGLTSVAVD